MGVVEEIAHYKTYMPRQIKRFEAWKGYSTKESTLPLSLLLGLLHNF